MVYTPYRMQHFTFVRRVAVVSLFTGLSLQAPVALLDGPRLVISDNFADPSFIEHNGAYFAFSTQNGKANVPVAFSQDFDSWETTPIDAMKDMPVWSSGSFWAPHVTQLVSRLYQVVLDEG